MKIQFPSYSTQNGNNFSPKSECHGLDAPFFHFYSFCHRIPWTGTDTTAPFVHNKFWYLICLKVSI